MSRTELSGYITLRCNSRCVHCAANAGQKGKEEMSFEHWRGILKGFSEIGGRTFVVHGGEPFMRSDMIRILQHATSLGVKCGIITNGLLLSDNDLLALRDCTDWVLVSLDGPGKVYEELRGVDGSERVIGTIKKAKEIGVNVAIDLVVTRKNIGYVDWVVDVAVALKLEWLTLELLRAQGRAQELKDYLLEDHDILEVGEKTQTLNQMYKGRPRFVTHGVVDLEQFKENQNSFMCADNTLYFLPDGTLVPDIALPNISYWYAGNLLKGFELNKEKVKEYRDLRALVFENVCAKLAKDCPVNWEEEVYTEGTKWVDRHRRK